MHTEFGLVLVKLTWLRSGETQIIHVMDLTSAVDKWVQHYIGVLIMRIIAGRKQHGASNNATKYYKYNTA